MVENKDKWSSLSMKERMFLMQEYVKNGITDLTSMRKHYNGIPYSDLNTSDYDYFNASPDMEPKKEGQHWDSRNSETGRILKREDHPTFDLAVKGENEAGYVIRKGIDGNLYSIPNQPNNYVEKPNILDGTETEQTLSGKKLTLEEFIQSKVDSTRNAALEKSYTRVKGVEIPYEFGENEKSSVQRTLEFSEPYARLTYGPYTKKEEENIKTINYYLGRYYQAKKELEDNCKYGFNCIGTVTDNYPEESRTESNKDFDENFEKYGFQYVGMKNAKPGDIAKIPEHAMIYVGTDANGNPLFNYSDGGITEYNYKKDARYPSPYYAVYTYVGTPELIQQWTTEYENTYNKKYGGKLNKFATGGPTREMTPSEAAEINKMLNNSQYMLAVGDSPDDPAYLSTDVLEPSITKAFDSTEDYNRYYGDLFGRNITKKSGRLARKTGKIAYDIGQFIPYLGTALDLGEMVYGDELSKQTAAFSNVGSPISALTKLDKYKSVSNFGGVWGTLLQAPDFILDLYTLYKDIKKPLSQYANGGRILDGKTEDNQTLDNEGGWSDNSRARRERRYGRYDPTGNYILQPLYMLMGGNQASGEENEYWKAYLGLENAVPKMNPKAKTPWDDAVEAEKIAKGELPSDFYGTTPRMDLNIQAIADTLNTGKILRNYDKYKEGRYTFPSKKTIEEIYKTGKRILENPNTWQQVEGDNVAIKAKPDDTIHEYNPLGMLADFGMMWNPKEKNIYVHDTYDFPALIELFSGKRPKEMKIRGKINFDPKKGSKLLRDDLKYFYDYPEPLTSE